MVVAYAIAGSMTADMWNQPAWCRCRGAFRFPWTRSGRGPMRLPLWSVMRSTGPRLRRGRSGRQRGETYGTICRSRPEAQFAWNPNSEYLRPPRYVTELAEGSRHRGDVRGARILMLLGDNITTDHISPAGAIRETDVAGRYLAAKGATPRDLSVFAARRGNFEVMARGAFSNPLLENEIVPGRRGGLTRHWPDGKIDTVFAVAETYRAKHVPTVVIAGHNFGAGSSRDWAAKGLQVLGVRAVIAESFERIHRCNLIDMGILPLQFPPGIGRVDLRLDGSETIFLEGLENGIRPRQKIRLSVRSRNDDVRALELVCRADTFFEAQLLENGGFIAFYLRGIGVGAGDAEPRIVGLDISVLAGLDEGKRHPGGARAEESFRREKPSEKQDVAGGAFHVGGQFGFSIAENAVYNGRVKRWYFSQEACDDSNNQN